MNPNALDRTAAWLLNMNVQFLEEEGAEPECKHRNRDELGQGEKVTMLARHVSRPRAPGPRKSEGRLASPCPSWIKTPIIPVRSREGQPGDTRFALWAATAVAEQDLGLFCRQSNLQLSVRSLSAEKTSAAPLGNLQVCGLQLPESSSVAVLAMEFWELKSTHLGVTMDEKHWTGRGGGHFRQPLETPVVASLGSKEHEQSMPPISLSLDP